MSARSADDDDSDLFSIYDQIYFSLLDVKAGEDGQINLAGVPRGAELGSHKQLEIRQTWVEGTFDWFDWEFTSDFAN